jgi:hypothetical protein
VQKSTGLYVAVAVADTTEKTAQRADSRPFSPRAHDRFQKNIQHILITRKQSAVRLLCRNPILSCLRARARLANEATRHSSLPIEAF